MGELGAFFLNKLRTYQAYTGDESASEAQQRAQLLAEMLTRGVEPNSL
ncbi:MAG: hypothetical protein ACR2LR_23025 [Hassallia sp.]